MLSLRWKLGGALFLVVLVSIGLTAFLINRDTTAQFQQYVQVGNTAYIQKTTGSLSQYYLEHYGWQGVAEVLPTYLRNNGERLVLKDIGGVTIADTQSKSPGKSASDEDYSSSNQILADGKTVGTLYFYLNGSGSGRGYMGGRAASNQSASAQTTAIYSAEDQFLARINRYLWIAGLIALAVALLLGLLVTRQITRPLSRLSQGAKHLSEGDLTHRVNIKSRDEIGQVAKSFNEMAVKLDASEKARRRLVSDIAHELKTPLTVIQGTVEGISDGVFAADPEHLDNIREQTLMLNRLVSDLRELSLVESGQLKLDLALSDSDEIVRRKINQFEAQIRQKHIHLDIDIPVHPEEIRIDSKRIEQVIANLLSNAIRHTPDGGSINVSLRNEDSGANKKLVLSISDNGEGIAAEHLPHIFDRFYRVETSRSRSEGGTGLGLAIVKQMVEAHGGRVSVESQPGRGSAFTVFLPYNSR